MGRSNLKNPRRFYLLLLAGVTLALALILVLASLWAGQNYRTIALFKHRIENHFTPAGATIFVGDSLVSSADWNEYLPQHSIVNRGIYGDDTNDLLGVIPRVLDIQPSQLVILIGINDLNKQLDWQQSKTNLSRIFDHIDDSTPEIRVVLVELLPTNDSWHRKIDFDAVSRFNQFLEQQADERQYTFARVASSLGEGHDRLKPEFTRDGIHLSSEGYRVLGQALEPYLLVGNTASS